MGTRDGRLLAFLPAAVLLLAAGGQLGLQPGTRLALEASLAEMPARLGPYEAAGNEPLSEAELRVLAPDDYLLREYRASSGARLDLFVAYFGSQESGSTIHSPRNCLPGSGWEAVSHRRARMPMAYGPAEVNRYLVEHDSGARALVFYWYQGRGRVAANEYAVKWHLVRDALLKRRTDEALVRVVLPLGAGDPPDEAAAAEAVRAASEGLAGLLPA